jgi:hypothetical protein
VSFFARALPPLSPRNRPRLTAVGFFSFSSGFSTGSVACRNFKFSHYPEPNPFDTPAAPRYSGGLGLLDQQQCARARAFRGSLVSTTCSNS